MLKLLKKLYQVNLITPIGIYKLISSIVYSGINSMTLLRFSAKLYPKNIALVGENEEITFQDLLIQTEQLTLILQEEYAITYKQKVAIIARNHASLIRSLFSVSQLGADIYLLNVEMSNTQFNYLADQYNFDLVIHDHEISELFTNSAYKKNTILSYHQTLPSIDNLSKTKTSHPQKIRRAGFGKIIILTGGTTGNPKTAERKPSLLNFLNPFFALLVKLDLNSYQSVYIATPVYHGFGIATVFISLLLGMKMFLLEKFNVQKACQLIDQQKIEVVTLVPLMLQRMIAHKSGELDSLSCIISGGAPLSSTLVADTFSKLGYKLFNLYGTSEAGFAVMATPDDLRYSSTTIGREIKGVKLRIYDSDNKEIPDGTVGRICISSKWSVKNIGNDWIETGDLGYKDKLGYYFLCGRIDDMIVSGGENVYPVELENILVQHQEVEQVAVIGISDEEFGQRLKAFIVPAANSKINKEEILNWLSVRAARFQMPKQIEFLTNIPYTSLGKPNKRILS
ncbi:MAG: AMP-binding protein [Daejeonella sp.]